MAIDRTLVHRGLVPRKKKRVALEPTEIVPGVIPGRMRSLQTRTAILQAIRDGLPRTYACKLAGISRDALREYVAEGQAIIAEINAATNGHAPEMTDAARFALELIKAETSARAQLLGVIWNAAMGTEAEYDDAGNLVRAETPRDPKWAAWMIERIDPREFGFASKIEHIRRDEDGAEESLGLPADEMLEQRLSDIERRLSSTVEDPEPSVH